jgi:hypothetical protein
VRHIFAVAVRVSGHIQLVLAESLVRVDRVDIFVGQLGFLDVLSPFLVAASLVAHEYVEGAVEFVCGGRFAVFVSPASGGRCSVGELIAVIFEPE